MSMLGNKIAVLEQSLVRVPVEKARRLFKNVQRSIERENVHLKKQMEQLIARGQVVKLSDSSEISGALEILDSIIERVTLLREKLMVLRQDQVYIKEILAKRSDHIVEALNSLSTKDPNFAHWMSTRLNRLIAEYLLVRGYLDSAGKLVEDRNLNGLVDVSDIAFGKAIEYSLKQRRTAECLNWCHENKPSLKKIESDLEFDVRLQQYIELVRSGDRIEAMSYFRKHIAGAFSKNADQIYHALALLAVGPDTTIPVYKELYSEDRWDLLAQKFSTVFTTLNCMPPYPQLLVTLSAGLTAMKTASCTPHEEMQIKLLRASNFTRSALCPICYTELSSASEKLPYAHHTKPHVEPELVLLPNGHVYSKPKLIEHAKTLRLDSDTTICDPFTGQNFSIASLKPVYAT
ncbi:hypothetical protein CANCADRAFT_84569 [Tortispora caseinolytica NRRL Y-17796]|uniref:Uncharacterized protein n=1 Tax=Tortispora caseinolytica NRRL Y-17796 TaxID=767744 RepID=A0A1E4TKJ9_9ASCO|nr:hypothetical protein CANCADRAFT_84569 [Tortispora caseinolytica NRRL Y-17796]